MPPFLFSILFRTTIFFDADDAGGGAPATGGEPDPTSAEGAGAEPAGLEPSDAGDPADPDLAAIAAEPEAPDYASRIEEWGGEEAIKKAVALDRALQSREGVQGLLEEAGKFLYGSDPEKAALFAQLLGQDAPAAPADPLAELLSDPDRELTAAEVEKVVEARVAAALKKHVEPLEQRQQQEAIATIDRNITANLTEFEVPEAAHRAVLDAADAYITSEADASNPTKLKDAIRRGYDDWKSDQEKQHAAYLQGKKDTTDDHPKTLTGTPPGGVEPTEPQNMTEAKARVRASMPAAFRGDD